MPQTSISGNWFSMAGRALLEDARNLRASGLLGELRGPLRDEVTARSGPQRVRSQNTYSDVAGHYPSDVECDSSCGLCYPVDPEWRPYFDGTDSLDYFPRRAGGASGAWFNGFYATTQVRINTSAHPIDTYPAWWDYLWHGRHGSIESVMSEIEERIADRSGN